MTTKFLNPLEGAAPTLRPTAQPYDTGIGATAPSQRSPSAELARAFEGFNSELVGALRDVALQQEHDAEQLGQAKAAELNASDGMASAEAKLKKYVDDGVIPASRAPAFERGFRTRYGMSIADSLNTSLLTRMSEATRTANRVDPSQIIQEEKQKLLSTIHPADQYALVGFTHAASAVEQGFRARAAEEYAKNYEKDGMRYAADTGSKLVSQWAAAPAELKDTIKAGMTGHLDDLRKELPVGDVNTTFVRQSVYPAFADLLSQNRFEEARQVLAIADLDVTGKGGLLGQIAENKVTFADMRNKLEAQERTEKAHSIDDNDRLYTASIKDAQNSANAVIAAQYKVNPNSAVLFSDIERRTDEYASTLPEDTFKGTKVKTFRDSLTQEWGSAGQVNQKRYEYEVGSLLNNIVSLRTEDLDNSEARLNHFRDINAIQPSEYAAGLNKIKQLRANYGVYDEQDVKKVVGGLFAKNPAFPSIIGITFSGDNKELDKAWTDLPDDKKNILQATLIQATNDALRAELGKQPNVMAAKQAVDAQLPLIQNTIREKAIATLKELSGITKREKEQAVVSAQAEAIRKNADKTNAVFMNAPVTTNGRYDMDYTFKARFGRNSKLEDVHTDFQVPDTKARTTAEIQAQWKLPPAERDFIDMPVQYHGLWNRFTSAPWERVDLSTMAAKAKSTEGRPEEAAKASNMYAFAKSVLGFTPDEVLKGETKHGVKFDAVQIDPTRIRVFRTRAELAANWNSGQPTELFTQVGNTVGADHMKPKDFYLAQLALLPK